MSKLHAILSIHDVAPHTIERVARIIEKLPSRAKQHLILLVIPGLAWNDHQIAQLQKWERTGYILAGHGWLHKTKKIQTIFHKLHSIFISRDVAEHLSLSEHEILALMKNNRAWFEQNELSTPNCYVPPAWALGRISKQTLTKSGYRFIETTKGYIDLQAGEEKNLPLIGFEADSGFRKQSLYLWNLVNAKISSVKKPVRMSIHPYDDEHLLASSMWAYLEKVDTFHHYDELFA